jgi:hypothetical protein
MQTDTERNLWQGNNLEIVLAGGFMARRASILPKCIYPSSVVILSMLTIQIACFITILCTTLFTTTYLFTKEILK